MTKQITEKEYRSLISSALKTGDSFSLAFSTEVLPCSSDILNEMQALSVRQKNIYAHPDTTTCFDAGIMLYYEINDNTTRFLQRLGNIFDSTHLLFPCDLCFYLKGKLICSCITHEQEILKNN